MTRTRKHTNTKKHSKYSKKSSKTRKNTKDSKPKVYTKDDFNSGDGMLTSVWGPALWHYLHTMSFNYPVRPTQLEKRHYMDFVLSLEHVLPCKYCRMNLKNNFKSVPLTMDKMKSRATFSRYIYNLHEHINKMLGKKSGLTYDSVREQYEHFRARCTIDPEQEQKIISMLQPTKENTQKSKTKSKTKSNKKTKSKEKGCTEPLYGKKSKCIIKIVPQDTKCKTFEIHEKCKKTRKRK